MQEKNKKAQFKHNHIKVTGWEIVDIKRKLNFFNFLLIILLLLEAIQLFL